MTISHGFRQLANVLENLEANGLEVLDVATADDDSSERLTVDLTVTVPADPNASKTQPALSDGGATDSDAAGQPEESSTGVREQVLDPLAVSAEATNGATAIKPLSAASTELADAESETRDDETAADDDPVDCPVDDCDATFESNHGMRIHRTKVHGDDHDGTDDETPSYRNPERLREVYAACDSFTEMREALETDVSTQTVRRQMIAHDIYEPGESASGSEPVTDDESDAPDGSTATDPADTADGDEGVDGEDASENEAVDDGAVSEQATDEDAADEDAVDDETADEDAADDESELEAVELPEGVSVADLKEGVASAQTLYDVQQHFDLDRDEAMELLETYDLLEVVHGRVSNRDLRKQVDEEEITRRILEHAPGTQPSQA